MRTIIEVPDDVIKRLDRVGQQEKKSRAAIIREAISTYLQQKAIAGSDAAFGIWKGKGRDGLHYQKEMRSEWDKDTKSEDFGKDLGETPKRSIKRDDYIAQAQPQRGDPMSA